VIKEKITLDLYNERVKKYKKSEGMDLMLDMIKKALDALNRGASKESVQNDINYVMTGTFKSVQTFQADVLITLRATIHLKISLEKVGDLLNTNKLDPYDLENIICVYFLGVLRRREGIRAYD
jgi:hypothetical protein